MPLPALIQFNRARLNDLDAADVTFMAVHACANDVAANSAHGSLRENLVSEIQRSG